MEGNNNYTNPTPNSNGYTPGYTNANANGNAGAPNYTGVTPNYQPPVPNPNMPGYQPPQPQKKKTGKIVAIVLACLLIPGLIIAVSLVASVASQYGKYVQQARNATMAETANDYLSAVKAAYADPTMGAYDEGIIYLYCDDNGKLVIESGGISSYTLETINDLAGIEEGEEIKADVGYEIVICQDYWSGGYEVKMQQSTDGEY